jgi:hypothetical protein
LEIVRTLVAERVERGGVKSGFDQPAREDRLHLRGEDKTTLEPSQIERLDSEPVAAGDQVPLGPIVKQERKLAAKMLEAIEAMLAVERNDYLGIRTGREMVALRFQ